MIPTPEMAYAEFVGNRLLIAVLGRARVLAIPKRRSDAPVLHAAGRRLAWRHEPAASGGRRGHRTTHAPAAAASRLRLESHREMGAAVDTTHTPINRSEAIARDSVSFPEPSLSGGD